MGCAASVSHDGDGASASRQRNRRRDVASEATSMNGDIDATDTTGALGIVTVGGDTRDARVAGTTREKDEQYRKQRGVEGGNEKSQDIDEPFLTEEFMLEFAEYGKRKNGQRDKSLQQWLAQIPDEPPKIDPFVYHTASMAALRQLQEEKRREKAQSPRKKRKSL